MNPLQHKLDPIDLDDSYLPNSDIRVSIKERFNAIKRYHPLKGQLPESWPSAVDVNHLPTDRLRIVLGIMSRGKDTPFASLDEFYTYIFSVVENINKVLEVFSVLLLVKTSLAWKSPDFIETLLGLRSGDLKIMSIDLHSILDIPVQVDAGEIQPYLFWRPSF
ncbi:hypothetical protein BYT27DRAFT_7264914 [Phlegmacium glaucopus]|nr:hypothetical protein BYT27DRAFT_7264914 [Phlegmacium glaucopus]